MDNPQPVDTNRLKSILAASKNIMRKVESGDYETGKIDPRALTEDHIGEIEYDPAAAAAASASKIGYTEEQVRNSRLPEAIKNAMIKNPIPKLSGPSHTFNLEDVSEKPMGLPKVPKTTPKRLLPESYTSVDSDTITINKEELSEMVSNLVNEKLLEFFVQNHNKRITEDAVKKTIGLLIKEGKLKKAVQ